MKKLTIQALGLATAIVAVGCADPNTTFAPPEMTQGTRNPVMKKAEEFRPASPAGVEIAEPPAGGPLWAQLISSRSFSTRPDPFALQPRERNYEVKQTTERVFGEIGAFRFDYIPPVETVVVPKVEPQPYRRLAGVIVGDSVLALIDMGDGRLEIIRPGQEIQGWRVVSIDGDKAILRRAGNVLPREITVRLEEPPPGVNSGSGSGNTGGGGTPSTTGGGRANGGRPGAGGPGLPGAAPGGG